MSKKMLTFIQNSALLLFSVICIELLLRLAGYGYNYLNSAPASSVKAQSDTEKILCIGESTTAWGAENSYPSKLQKMLDQYYGANKYIVINEGVAGTNSAVILKKLKNKIQRHNPDIVITMIGVNDVWSLNQPLTFWDNFRLYKFFKLLKNNIKTGFSSKSISDDLEDTEEEQIPDRKEPLPATVRPEEARPVEFTELINFATTELQNQNFKKVEEILIKISKIGAPTSEVYYLMGEVDLEKGDIPASKKHFHRYVDILKSYEAASRVGVSYFIKTGGTDKATRAAAKEFLKISLQYHPTGWQSNKYLGFISLAEKDETSALNFLKTAYDNGSRDFDLLTSLGSIYDGMKNFDEAEAVLKSGLYEKGEVIWLWIALLNFYIDRERFEDAEKYFSLAEEKFPGNQQVAEAKASLYKAQGKPFNRNDIYNVKNFYDFPVVKANYLKVAEIIKRNGPKHVVMQYPLRPIGPLKTILANYKEIVYVDNEKLFQDALTKHSYDELFIDRFGGDFGHATSLGNELISQNIIRALQAEKLLPSLQ